EFSIEGISLQPLCREALETVRLQLFPRLTHELAAAESLLAGLKPEIVLLRASVSAQTHFAALAYAARKLHIPAIELQHGIEYLGPGSVSRYHTAEYIAVY